MERGRRSPHLCQEGGRTEPGRREEAALLSSRARRGKKDSPRIHSMEPCQAKCTLPAETLVSAGKLASQATCTVTESPLVLSAVPGAPAK